MTTRYPKFLPYNVVCINTACLPLLAVTVNACTHYYSLVYHEFVYKTAALTWPAYQLFIKAVYAISLPSFFRPDTILEDVTSLTPSSPLVSTAELYLDSHPPNSIPGTSILFQLP